MSDNLKLQNYKRPELKMPNGEKNLLLHSCCAPCAGELMEAMLASKIDLTIYFYNPNIHPKKEYYSIVRLIFTVEKSIKQTCLKT